MSLSAAKKPTSATVVRFVTSKSKQERTVTITKSNKNGGRLLLDFGHGGDKEIISLSVNGRGGSIPVEDFVQAIIEMATNGEATDE